MTCAFGIVAICVSAIGVALLAAALNGRRRVAVAPAAAPSASAPAALVIALLRRSLLCAGHLSAIVGVGLCPFQRILVIFSVFYGLAVGA